jgi:hypothetical protein
MVGILPHIRYFDIMRNEFSTFDIVKALGIPRERLKDWMNNGFVKPTVPAEGQGTKAIFTRVDLYLTELFRDLLNKGFKRDRAADFTRKISERLKWKKEGLEEGAERLAVIIFKYVHGDDQAISANLVEDPITEDDNIDLRWGRSGTLSLQGVEEDLRPLTLELMQRGELESGQEDVFFPSQNWDHLLVVNFKTLKKRVDTALTILD